MKYVLDTDHVSRLIDDHPQILYNLLLHPPGDVLVSVITVEEELVGWLTVLRQARDLVRRERLYRRMAQTTMGLSGLIIVPFSLAAMNRHEGLLKQRLNVASNDLKIAAIALEIGAKVVTTNRRDFSRVPGLAITDWTV